MFKRKIYHAAGPESLEDYFQKGKHFYGQKAAQVFGTSIPGQIHKNLHNSIVSFQYRILTYSRQKGEYSLLNRDN